MIRSKRHLRRGFTLIESMATIVVLATISSIASLLLIEAIENFMKAANGGQLLAELSTAMDRATRQLHKIPLDTGASGIAPDIDSVTQVGSADAIVWRDSGGDAYSLTKSGSDIELAVDGGAAQVLISDVTTFDVSIFKEDNSAIAGDVSGTSCDDIRRITLDATVSRNGITQSLRSKLFLRSTMEGGGS